MARARHRPSEPTLAFSTPAWILTFALLGFCGVPSTSTIGPLTCVCVVELLATTTTSVSTFTRGGALGPSLRRPLNTLDMLTSRCKTLRGLDSVRRIPAASCSRETERERERDCDRDCDRAVALLRVEPPPFACELMKSAGGSGSWSSTDLVSASASVSASPSSESDDDDDVHCGIRNSFLRKSLYCSGNF